MTHSFLGSALRLLPFATAFAVGVLMVGYGTITYATYAYMQANPSIGSISTTAGFELFTLLVFLLGAVVAFLSAGAALYRVREDTS